MRSSVKYLFAKDQFKTTVTVEQARRGENYFCIGCDRRMIPRRGRIVAHHFAHYRSTDCSGDETALHQIAKELIRSGYKRAVSEDAEYRAVVDCSWIRSIQPHPALSDLRAISDRVVVERQLPGSRFTPDLYLARDDQPTVIIEVEITNPLSDEKRDHYEQRGLPVLIVKPTWENVWRLERGLWADNTMHIELYCSGHIKSEERRVQLEQQRAVWQRQWEQFGNLLAWRMLAEPTYRSRWRGRFRRR